MSGCWNIEVGIDGDKNINVNEEHKYRVTLLSKGNTVFDSYKWEVVSKSRDYKLSNETTKELTFSTQKAGKYTLKVTATKNTKRYTATLVVEVKEQLIIDGHVLPVDPGEEGKKTLLGIDSNNNGVRDDVERWIYLSYKEPIERGIFMQSARAYQKVIVDPSKAHETVVYLDMALSCEFYWQYEAKDNNETYLLDEYKNMGKEIKAVQFNTLARHMAYERYNAEFSGEILSSPPTSKGNCKFDENGLLRP